MEVQFIVNSNNQSRQSGATKRFRKANGWWIIVAWFRWSHCLQQFTCPQTPNSNWLITANCTRMQSVTQHTTWEDSSGLVVSSLHCGVREPRFESHHGRLCLSWQPLQYTALGMGCATSLQCLVRLSLTLHGTVKWASAYGMTKNNSGDGGCGR